MDWGYLPLYLLLFFLVTGMPVAFALTLSIIPYFLFINTTIPVDMIIQRMVASSESVALMAIPFFISAGVVMNYAGITKRLMKLADLCVGHIRGALGHVNVILSALNGGMSGSAAADAAVECKILVPEMVRLGYDKPFCAAVTATSSLITPIIPPGIGLVVYAFLANVSVGQMFFAGYVPGLLMTVGLCLLVAYLAKKRNYRPTRERRAPMKEVLPALKEAIWALFLPFGLVLGLRVGFFTPTEGGAMCALYSFLVGAFVYKEIKLKDIPAILVESVLGTATTMMILCMANAFGFFLSWERIPHMLSAMLIDVTTNKYIFTLIVLFVFLFLGMFLDGTASMIILVPLFAPVASSLGINLIHFGIMIVLNITIGNITPPFGIVMYLTASLMNLRVADFIKELLPFIMVMLFVLFLVAFVPIISLFLPNMIF